ncbi:MAG: YqaE/Pmp3 family membrane protein [Ignavibacteria bacterium]|nr:YqaE/Pmp3 family membrane protein [Ignavibacteria bacterium]
MNASETVDTEATEASAQAAPAPRGSGGVPKWFLIVLCIFLPPLAVALVYGITDKFWIDLLLTLCFWLPGVIYALIQVL